MKTFAQRQAEVADPDPRYDQIVKPPVYQERLEDEIAEMADAIAKTRGRNLDEAQRRAFFRELTQFGEQCCALCVERGDAKVLYREPSRAESMALAGRLFYRALAWIAEANTLVRFGQRARIMIYVLRPALIGAATLEELGKEMGVTRQDVHKYKRELEDTFRDCFATRTDKPEDARQACKTTPHIREY